MDDSDRFHAEVMAQLERRDDIVTTFVYPPFPDRRSDWQAIRKDWEPGCSHGEGATEQEAIDDLIASELARLDAWEARK